MLLGQVVRNGVIEAEHHGAVAIWGSQGLVSSGGDIDRPFFARSAAKPFQLVAALRSGLTLTDQELAIGASSHGGFPAHLAYVRQILANAGLDEGALQTPPDWPLHPGARDLVVRGGATHPQPLYHNCSGKHAVWLAACVARGWDTEAYLSPEHPLQQEIRAVMGEVTGSEIGSPGVDGCGAPVWRISVAGLARAFYGLGNDPEFSTVWTAMHRYPALTSDNGKIDQQVATVLNAAAKVGAEACMGVALAGSYGIGVKSWDGSMRGLEAGMVGTLDALGMTIASHQVAIGASMDEAVLGGGIPQGEVEPRVLLRNH